MCIYRWLDFHECLRVLGGPWHQKHWKTLNAKYTLFNRIVTNSVSIPWSSIFGDGDPSRNNFAWIIAWAAGRCNTVTILVHVCSFCTATAIYWHKVNSAGGVWFAEGSASAVTAGHLIGVDRGGGASQGVLFWEEGEDIYLSLTTIHLMNICEQIFLFELPSHILFLISTT